MKKTNEIEHFQGINKKNARYVFYMLIIVIILIYFKY
jgi:hypothetical protein